jgi:hypothetical protein
MVDQTEQISDLLSDLDAGVFDGAAELTIGTFSP